MCDNEKVTIKTCIEIFQKRINNLFDTLGWTEENTLKEHKSNTLLYQIRKEKYDKNDPLYPDTIVAKNFVKFETVQQILNSSNNRDLPQKFSDFQTKFNHHEKLSLYEHVINKTDNLTEPAFPILHFNINGVNSSSNKQMTFSEIVAMRRDEKRRRLKFRTTKTTLSVTEEVRQVIAIQMQAFDQYTTKTNQSEEKKSSGEYLSIKHKSNEDNQDETSASHRKHKKKKRNRK